MREDYMLDLETAGTSTNAPILSIGAVKFDIYSGRMIDTFYTVVDLSSCVDLGMKIEAGTFYWWLSEKVAQQARNDILDKDNSMSIVEACHAFGSWIETTVKNRRKAHLWGNGSGFDNVILRNAFIASNVKFPLGYGRDRDVRTIVDMSLVKDGDFIKGTREGTYHNAVADAEYQVQYVSRAWKILQGN